MLRRKLSGRSKNNNYSITSEFWLSPVGLQFHISEDNVKGKYDRWELCISVTALDNMILLIARFGNCIGYLYLGATVKTMYKLFQTFEEKNGLDFICVITDKKKRYVQYMRRFFLKEEFMKDMQRTLKSFSPVTDEFMDDMNDSRSPQEFLCEQLSEKTGIWIGIENQLDVIH